MPESHDSQPISHELERCKAELRFLRNAQNAGNIGSWLWDIPNNDITWSDNIEAIFGLKHGEFAGTFEGYQELIPDNEKDIVAKHVEACLSGKATDYHLEHHVEWKDGSIHWLEAWGTAQFNDSGEPISMTGTVMDITERKIIDDCLIQLTNATSTVVGQAFLEAFVLTLGKILDVDYTFIGRYDKAHKEVTTVSLVNRKHILPNMSYSIIATPCAEVLDNRTCIIPDNIQDQFPDDTLLREMQISGYIGAPLLNHEHKSIGLLVMLFKKPIPNCNLYQQIFDLFRPRIIAELDRIESYLDLAMSEKRYRHLIQNAPEAIVIFDLDSGLFVDANKAAENLFKLPLSEFLKIGPAHVSPVTQENGKSSKTLVEQHIRAAIQQNSTPFEWQHIDSAYNIINCEVRLQCVADKNKTLIRGTIVDIGERKAAVQTILNNEENLRITLNSIADAVIATDTRLNITRINPVAEQLIETSADYCIGKPLEKILSLNDLHSHHSIPLQQVLFDIQAIPTQNTFILISSSGQEFSVSCNASPIKTIGNKEIGTVFVLRDITQQQETENQLRQAQKMESIGQLAGGIAHDFNNMLAGILATSELLGLQLKDEKQQTYIQTIVDTSLRAADLTQQLLSFSRKGKIESKQLNIHLIINNVLVLLNRSIDKRISIKTDLRAAQVHVNGDQSQLESALLNLGINARDAMPKGGTLNISTCNVDLTETECSNNSFDIQPGNFIRISVSDTGTGINQEIISHIFEPFFTTKGIGEGTGLGLAAVYGTTCGHHGMVTVDTNTDTGSAFSIYLPSASKTDSFTPNKRTKLIAGSGNILIIDDEETIRRTTANLLTNIGYTVSTAENGSTGIKLVREKPEHFQAIILDMIMPDINGREVYHSIKSMNPSIKVLIASGFAHDKDINDLLEAGADSFLQKPFRFHELSHVLAELMTKEKN